MRFEKHVFISYGHVDNLTTSDEEQGWVTRFHTDLEAHLSFNLGRQAEIWRDDLLRGNDLVESEILKQFLQTATLVSVLSKRYLLSPWCQKELEAFCRAAECNGGLSIMDKTRVFKVMLRPVESSDRGRLPKVLHDALGYEFYQEIEGRRFLPLDPKLFGNKEAYHRRVFILAQDVAVLVEQLEERAPGVEAASTGPPTQSTPVIYLAECSYDRAEERQKLRDELQANGYTVLPARDAHLPELETEYVAEIRRLLLQCDLSIHLMGSFPGKVPDGSSAKSAVQLQNEVAARLSAETRLRRIIWMPSDVEKNSSFVRQLTRDAQLQSGADLIAGDFEEMKSNVRLSLKKITDAAVEPETAQRAPGSVYLICIDDDLEGLTPMTEFLSSMGFTLELPVFSGDPAHVRQANEAAARTCDAVIVFCGAGDGAWILHQHNELKRVFGLRRQTPWLWQGTYVSGPATADKRALFLKKPPGLINGLDGFKPELMQPLVDLLSA